MNEDAQVLPRCAQRRIEPLIFPLGIESFCSSNFLMLQPAEYLKM